MKTKIISSIKIVVLTLALTLGLSYLSAWTGPTANPPDGNIPAPVNVGASRQYKTGSLQVNTSVSAPDTNGLDVYQNLRVFMGNIIVGTTSAPGTIQIVDGNQATGRVLTSDANGIGHWANATSTNSSVQTGYATSQCSNHVSTQCDGEPYIDVTFPTAFGSVPKVIVSPRMIANNNQGTDLVVVRADNITATGFRMVCSGSPTIANNYNTGDCSWMAVGDATSGGGGISWASISLSDSSDFDQSCQYRFKTSDTAYAAYSGNNPYYYATGVASTRLTYISHAGVISYISSTAKTAYSVSNYSPGITVSTIEKGCAGGGSGVITDGLTQYKQHRGISGFPSYIECDNNGNAGAGTGKLLLTVEETGLSPYFGTGDTVIYGNPSGTGTAGDISVVYGKTSGSLRKITISGTGDGGQGYSSFNCPLSVHTDGSTQIEYYSY